MSTPVRLSSSLHTSTIISNFAKRVIPRGDTFDLQYYWNRVRLEMTKNGLGRSRTLLKIPHNHETNLTESIMDNSKTEASPRGTVPSLFKVQIGGYYHRHTLLRKHTAYETPVLLGFKICLSFIYTFNNAHF